jgi:hypothetical protein
MTTATASPLQRARFARKPASIEELRSDLESGIPAEAVHIEKTVNLTTADYEEFASNLLVSRPWLAGLGGFLMPTVRKVVAVCSPGRHTLLVDPSGSDYGRYVGLAVTVAPETDDQASAIAWLLENRRPEVPRDQAIRTLRSALAGDAKALRILAGLAGN